MTKPAINKPARGTASGRPTPRMRNLGFLLRDLSRRHMLRFEAHARRLSLTLSQCKVLVRLDANEGASQSRLAELADIEPMTMVRILDRMESDGLLERRPDPADRRARRLYLTERARPLVDEVWKLSDLTRAEMFAGIGASERRAFVEVLERLHANLVSLVGEPPSVSDAPRARGSRAAAPGNRS
jgi:MarR family transcriptional regulator, transcriptional regulator for hemolysin